MLQLTKTKSSTDPRLAAAQAHIDFAVGLARTNGRPLAVYVNPKTNGVQIRDWQLATCPNILAIVTADGRVESFEAGSLCVYKLTATAYRLVSNPTFDERLSSTVVRGVALSGTRRGMTAILPVVHLETVKEAA